MSKDVQESTFDADKARAEKERLVALKKSNFQSVFGSGAGRLGLIALGLCVVTLVVIGGMRLFGSSKMPKTPKAEAAATAVLAPPGMPGDAMATTEDEAAMRRAAAQRAAAQAQAEGKPYIAPPVLKADTPEPPKATPAASTPSPSAPAAVPITTPPMDAGKASLEAQKKLVDSVKAQIALQMRGTGVVPDGIGRSGPGTYYYAVPDRSAKASTTTAATTNTGAPVVGNAQTAAAGAAAAPASKPAHLLFGAGESCYGELVLGINSDDAGNFAQANVYPCKGISGIRLTGKYEVKGESVGITFDQLARPGKPAIKVTAVALNEETYGTGLADDVNSHTLKKFAVTGVAAFMQGLGQAAATVQGTTSTSNIGGTSTATTVTSPMSVSRQLEMATGQAGAAIGKQWQATADTIKPTVTTRRYKNVVIVFQADVAE